MSVPANPFVQVHNPLIRQQPLQQSGSLQQSPQLDSIIYYERPDTPRKRKRIFTPDYKQKQHLKHQSRLNAISPDNPLMFHAAHAIQADIHMNTANNMLGRELAHALDRNMQGNMQPGSTQNIMPMQETNNVIIGQKVQNLFTSTLQRHQSMPIPGVIQPITQSAIRNVDFPQPPDSASAKLAQMSIEQQLLQKQVTTKKIDQVVSQGIVNQDQNAATKKLDQDVAKNVSNGMAQQNGSQGQAVTQQLVIQTGTPLESVVAPKLLDQLTITTIQQPQVMQAPQMIPQQTPPPIQPFVPPTQTPIKTQLSQQSHASQGMQSLRQLQSIQSQKSCETIPKPPEAIPIVNSAAPPAIPIVAQTVVSTPSIPPIPVVTQQVTTQQVIAQQPTTIPVSQQVAHEAVRQSVLKQSRQSGAILSQGLIVQQASPIPVPPPISHQNLNNIVPQFPNDLRESNFKTEYHSFIPDYNFGLAMMGVGMDARASSLEQQTMNQAIINQEQQMQKQIANKLAAQIPQETQVTQMVQQFAPSQQIPVQKSMSMQPQMSQQAQQMPQQQQIQSEQMNQHLNRQMMELMQQATQQSQNEQNLNQKMQQLFQFAQQQSQQPQQAQQAQPTIHRPPAEVIQKVKNLQSQIDRLTDQLVESELRDSIREQRLQSVLFAKQKQLKKKQLQMEKQQKLLVKLRKEKDQRAVHIERLREEVERLRKNSRQQNERLQGIWQAKETTKSNRKPWERERKVDFSDFTQIFPRGILRSRSSSPENRNFVSFAPEARQYVVPADPSSIVRKLGQLISPIQPTYIRMPPTTTSLPTTTNETHRILVRDYETARVV